MVAVGRENVIVWLCRGFGALSQKNVALTTNDLIKMAVFLQAQRHPLSVSDIAAQPLLTSM